MKTYKSINLWVRFFKIVLPFVLIIGLDSCKLNHLRDLEPSGPVTRSIDDLFWGCTPKPPKFPNGMKIFVTN